MEIRQVDAVKATGEIRAVVFEGEVGPAAALAYLSGQPSTAVVSDQTWKNLVTNVGRQQMAKYLVGETTKGAGYMGLSTSAVVPALADVALPNEINRGVLTIIQSINSYYQRYVGYFTTVSFNSTGLAGEGLFDTVTTGGSMWADASIAVSKTNTQALIVDHRIQISS